MNDTRLSRKGFTIVELLVVIVVIGILAAITIISYTGIQQKAINASLQSDLSNASSQLKVFAALNGSYPVTNNCSIAESSTNICLKASGTNGLSYSPVNTSSPQAFHLTVTNSTNSYVITDNSAPYTPITCPAGYIVVPGNTLYGTNDFCVMKYEAKNVSGIATSQAATAPWNTISQTSAATTATAACTGCHLITESEWMTIAQNVLNVSSNWSGNSVGSGFIYSGHNDNSPASALDADTNDSNGYYGTGNVSPSNQRRTLTLSNGEVIWDFAGNIWDWTAGTSTTGQPGILGGGYARREWNAITTPGNLTPSPSALSTGIAGISSWDSSYGIGQVYSNANESGLRGIIRGGHWGYGSSAGVLTMSFDNPPSNAITSIGFRVAK